MTRSWVWWFGLMDQNSVFRPLCLPIVHSVHSCIITLNVHSRAVRTWLLGMTRGTNEKTQAEYAANQMPAWWLSELCWIDVGRMSCKFLAIFIWKVSSQSGGERGRVEWVMVRHENMHPVPTERAGHGLRLKQGLTTQIQENMPFTCYQTGDIFKRNTN